MLLQCNSVFLGTFCGVLLAGCVYSHCFLYGLKVHSPISQRMGFFLFNMMMHHHPRNLTFKFHINLYWKLFGCMKRYCVLQHDMYLCPTTVPASKTNCVRTQCMFPAFCVYVCIYANRERWTRWSYELTSMNSLQVQLFSQYIVHKFISTGKLLSFFHIELLKYSESWVE